MIKNDTHGFTLIELLGVIVILSLLVSIVLPRVVNSIKNSNDKLDELTVNLIENAAKIFIEENKNNFPKTDGAKYCISLKDLVDYELIKEPILTSSGKVNITDSKSVQVIYNEKFEYEIVDNNKCKINIVN